MLATPITQSPAGEEFTKHNEGLALRVYPDAGGMAAGWGHEVTGCDIGDPITLQQAEAWYASDIAYREQWLAGWLDTVPNQNQADSLLDWLYNVKEVLWYDSTLMRLAKVGDWQGCWNEFPKWCYEHKKGVLTRNDGLLKRRRLEQAVFLGQDWRAYLAQCDGKPWWPEQFSEEA